MIHIYRATRYPDRDFFTFQATDDTYRQFHFRFPVTVAESKRGFEGGYFVYLRDNYRDTFFDLIKSYIRQNYVPPELRLSAFRATSPLSGLWPAPMWQQKVTDAIEAVFSGTGYKVNEDDYAGCVQITPPKPGFDQESIQVYRGVSFRVEVAEDRYPLLWCWEQFWLFMDGVPASLKQIAEARCENSTTTQAIRHYTTRSADDQFNLLQRFVKRIPPLASCEGIAFEQQPATPQQLGLETWFWLHDSDTHFETSNGLRTILAQAMLEEGSGFYSQPDDIQVIILLPIPDSSPVVPNVDWEQVVTKAEQFLAQTLPDVEVPISTLQYPVEGDLGQTVQSVAAIMQNTSDRRVLCLMATPSPDARFSADAQLQAAEEQSFQLNKRLRDSFRGGYAVTLDWNNLQEASDLPFIINNALLGGLFRLNAQPWKLCNLPFESEPVEGNYFLGLVGDVEAGTVSGALFDYEGTLVAFGASHPDDRETKSGDFTDEVDEVVHSLLAKGIHHSRPQPTHLIVHISPDMANLVRDVEAIIQAQSVQSDIVSIDPGSGPRLWQPMNQQGTPSHGIAVGSEESKVAYLMNTLSVAEKVNRPSPATNIPSLRYIYPNPNTVVVRQLAGPTSMKTLAAHVYWLSVAHINALHRTVDTPVTVAYAQALYGHVSKTKRSMRTTRNYKRTLFWL